MSLWARWLKSAATRTTRTAAQKAAPRKRVTPGMTVELLEDRALLATSVFSFSASAYSINENVASATITVSRTFSDTSGNRTASITYSTSNGTAIAGADYTGTSGVLNFGTNELSKTFNIPILFDTLNEGNETVNLSLSNPTASGGSTASLGSPNTAVLTIIDDDPANLSINDVSLNEGNSGQTPFVFTVTLSNPSANSVTVDYAASVASPATANNGDMVLPLSAGSLTFTPGQTAKTITVNVKGDTTIESNETFFVSLSNATNATITDGQGVGTIVNDDFNSAPIASSGTALVGHRSGAGVDIPLVATDANGDLLTYLLVGANGGALRGTVTLSGNTAHYTPTVSADFVGTDTFQWYAYDGLVNSNTATVTVTLANSAPTVTVSLSPSSPRVTDTISATANAADVDGDAVNLSYVWKRNGNVVSGQTASTYTGTRVKGNTITVEVTPNDGHTNGAMASASVVVQNSTPTANSHSVSTPEDTARAITLSASDADGDTLSYIIVSGPSNGTLTGTGANRTYTPAANFNGSDSFTFKVNDGTADSNVATVSITVNAVNDAPVAVNDSYGTNEDTPLTVAALGVLGNDTDVDGNALTAVLVSNPTHGSVTLNANGSFTYTPAANSSGSDSFTYKTNDGSTDSNVATVNLTVTAVNDAPVAVNDSYSTNEDTTLTVPAATGVLVNDSDVDSATLSAMLVSSPAHGSLVLNTDGSFSYTPASDFNGSDSFTYKANDGSANSNVVTVSLTINAVNDAPVANPDTATTDEDTAVTINVLANDTDVDSDTLHVSSITQPTHGTATLITSGPDAGKVLYTPDPNYNGPDSFSYTANDGTVNSNQTTGTVTINPVNDAPVAVNDSYGTDEDTPINVTVPGVLFNDTDVDDDTLSVTTPRPVVAPSHGNLTFNPDGSFLYTPFANFHGTDTFTYKASDGVATSNVATVTVTVSSVNDAPVALADVQTTNEDTAVSGNVLTNDNDVDGDALTAVLVSGPAHGSLTLNLDGSYTYSPAANYHGPDSFTYKAKDGQADSSVVTVSITVNSVNDNPVAVNDTADTNEQTPVTVNVVANDSDVDGDTLTVSAATQGTGGSVTFSGGSVTYTPNAGFYGTDSFSYTVSDGNGGTATATVSVTVHDVTPPTTTVSSLSGLVGSNGWYRSAVTVALSATDSASGVAATFYKVNNGSQQSGHTITLPADGVHSVEYWSIDNAGNEELHHFVTIKVDQTAPTVTVSPDRSPDHNGWYNHPIDFTVAATDGGSGVASQGPNFTYSGPDNGSASVSASATDVSGNTASASYSFAYDATAPSTVAQGVPSGWVNQDVTVTLVATDNLSGVATTYYKIDGGTQQTGTSVAITTDGAHSIEFWSVDAAGNVETSNTVTVQLDKTAPSLAWGTVTGTPGTNGWYVSDVAVAYTTNDNLSGVASSSPSSPVVISAEGFAQTGSVTVTDVAGNSATFTTAAFKIDKTAPTIATAPANQTLEATGPTGAVATFAAAAADNLTPPVLSYSVASGSTFALGTTSVVYTATDEAGNQTSGSFTVTVQDTTGPEVTPPSSPTVEATSAAGAAVSFGAATAVDAVTANPTVRYFVGTQEVHSGDTFPLGSTTVGIEATDDSGNVGTAIFTVTVIDTTPPETVVVSAPHVLVASATASFEFGGSDLVTAMSGLVYSYSLDGSALTAITGASLTLSGLSEGVHTLAVRAADEAGNVDPTPATYSWTVDTVGPSTTATSNGQSYADAHGGWNNSDVIVTLAATDATSGVQTTYYSVDGGAAQAGTSLTLSAEGEHTVTFWSVDVAGNVEPSQTVTVKLDKTAPTITAMRNLLDYAAAHSGWNNTDVTASYTASDAGGSGLASSSTGSHVFSNEGAGQGHTFTVYDVAGNSASASIENVKIDKTAPTISGAPDRVANGFGWYNADVTVSFTAADNLSGVAGVTSPVTLGEGAGQSVIGTVTDQAGNTASTTVEGINIDKTAPTISYTRTAANGFGWNNSDVVVDFSGADGLSGVDTVVGDTTVTTEGANQSITGTVTDKAGNSVNYTVSGINIDKTAPTVNIATPSALAHYLLNAPVAASYSSSDALSTIDAMTGTVANGALINTSSTGPKTFTVSATDKAGNTSSTTVTYYVDYNTGTGFLAPVSHGRLFKLGSTIPVKFQLKDANGNYIRSLSAVTAIQFDGTNATATGGTALRYDSTAEQYVFNLSTAGKSEGTHTISAVLASGQTISVSIVLRNSNGAALVVDSGNNSGGASDGQLLAGDMALTIAGKFTAEQVARVQDTLTGLNALLTPYGASITLVASGGDVPANIVLHLAPTSVLGGVAEGILGVSEANGEITIIQGWDWYGGADATAIGARQFDFQTVVTHEIGHSIGLGHSADAASVMHDVLTTGTAHRAMTVADLQFADHDDDDGPDGLRASGAVAPTSAGFLLGQFVASLLVADEPGSPFLSVPTTESDATSRDLATSRARDVSFVAVMKERTTSAALLFGADHEEEPDESVEGMAIDTLPGGDNA